MRWISTYWQEKNVQNVLLRKQLSTQNRVWFKKKKEKRERKGGGETILSESKTLSRLRKVTALDSSSSVEPPLVPLIPNPETEASYTPSKAAEVSYGFFCSNSPTVCKIGAMVNTQGSLERGLRILSASSIEIWLCQEGGWHSTICWIKKYKIMVHLLRKVIVLFSVLH